jgi:hypothetical protein
LYGEKRLGTKNYDEKKNTMRGKEKEKLVRKGCLLIASGGVVERRWTSKKEGRGYSDSPSGPVVHVPVGMQIRSTRNAR